MGVKARQQNAILSLFYQLFSKYHLFLSHFVVNSPEKIQKIHRHKIWSFLGVS